MTPDLKRLCDRVYAACEDRALLADSSDAEAIVRALLTELRDLTTTNRFADNPILCASAMAIESGNCSPVPCAFSGRSYEQATLSGRVIIDFILAEPATT